MIMAWICKVESALAAAAAEKASPIVLVHDKSTLVEPLASKALMLRCL